MAAPADRPASPGAAATSALLKTRLGLARLALLWEQLWPALWPALFVAGLFGLAVLADLLPRLPGWLHAVALAAFAVAFAGALVHGLRRVSWPERPAAGRRLEVAGGVAHRPLTAVNDRLAAGAADQASAALWEVYRERRQAELRRLRVGLPRAGLARVDPWGLRAAVALLLIIAAFGAGSDSLRRLQRAVSPDLSAIAADIPSTLEVWITPPAYTGQAPMYLTRELDPAAAPPPGEDAAAPVSVPEGSMLLAQVHGGAEAPQILLDEAQNAFETVGPQSYRASLELAGGEKLAVEQNGRTLGEWTLAIVPDEPPTVAFTDQPAPTERLALRLAFEAADDYGLEGVQAVITRAEIDEPPPALELDLPLPGVRLKTAKVASFHDLTPHPWAGTPVTIQLQARDARGQHGETEAITITLPERPFHHPVAKAIIEQRKRLTLAPKERLPVVRALSQIASAPDAYDGDVVVVLGLRVAQRRLIQSSTPEVIEDVQSLLWDLALRVEEGDLGEAERRLRQAQQALQDALARNAPDEELERLMDELQRAIDEFLQALTEEMQRRMAEGAQPMPNLDPNAMVLERDDLQRMLDQARELLRGGARDAAKNMLSQLQQMLENLQAMPNGMPRDGQMGQAMEMMGELGQLAQRQQQLLDQTFRQMQQGDGQLGAPEAAEQEALRRQLGDLMRRFGEMTGDIPRPLGKAERSMNDAAQALGEGQGEEAVGAQTQALEQLRQAGQAMAEALAEQFGLGTQPGRGQIGELPNGGRDPLGRMQPGFGGVDTSDVTIPEEADLQRAREILDELRRRAGERARPRPEREYIDRLLKQF